MDPLAERLGIGSRHLRRLFLQHLGASPITVAQTRRLHFAKKLIDESHLPMGEIALASGFGSIRRFNAAFRKTYDRTPTHLRRLARKSAAPSENEYHFQLRFRPLVLLARFAGISCPACHTRSRVGRARVLSAYDFNAGPHWLD